MVNRAAAIAALGAWLALACAAANVASPAARRAVLHFDPANTQIDYSLAGWPHVTNGTFRLARGEIRIDPLSGDAAGTIVVSADSGNSGSGMRDREMKDSILEVQTYPEITFTPQHAAGRPSDHLEFPAALTGVLSLHGQPHPITLQAEVRRDGDRFVARTRFAVPYVAWGLRNPSLLIFRCADTVYVDIRAQGRVTWIAAGGDGARQAATGAPHPVPH